MFLRYLESLSQFWLRIFELCHLKVPCGIAYAFLKTDVQSRPIFITFYVLIIYIKREFELIPTKNSGVI